MASDKIKITIGGETIEVPAWATETTAEQLARYTKVSSTSLNSMLKDNKMATKTYLENKRILTTVGQQISTQTSTIKKDGANGLKLSKAQEQVWKSVKEGASNLKNAGVKFGKMIADGDLPSLASSIASVVGMGAAVGFAMGVLNKFSENLVQLTNTGVGFGLTLQELRNDATMTGLSLDNYGKIISANSEAITALGDSTTDGAREFSQLSSQLRATAQDLNQFGLSNTEYNEILAEEIDLRRKMGMSSQEITDSLNASMNGLLMETTKLAAMTGQDRREMLRNRQELLSNPAIEAFTMKLTKEGGVLAENFGSIASVLGRAGKTGNDLALAFGTAIATNQDFATVQQGLVAEIAAIGGSGVSNHIRDMFEFARDNYASLPTDEFTAKMAAMVGQLGDVVSPEDLANLSNLASAGNGAAAELINLISSSAGVNSSYEEHKVTQEQAAEAMKLSLLGLASSTEEMTNRIKDSTLNQVFAILGTDIESGGQALVDGIRRVASFFGPEATLLEGSSQLIGETWNAMDGLQKATVAATVALGVMTVAMGPMSAMGAIFKGGRGAGRLIGRGAAAVSGALGRGPLGYAAVRASQAAPSLLSSGASAAGRLAGNSGRVLGGMASTGARLGANAARFLPAAGLAVGGALSINELRKGNILGGTLQGLGAMASMVPVVGTAASIGLTGAGIWASNRAERERAAMTQLTPEQSANIRPALEEHNRQREIDMMTHGTDNDPLPDTRMPLDNEGMFRRIDELTRETRETNRILRRQNDTIDGLGN